MVLKNDSNQLRYSRIFVKYRVANLQKVATFKHIHTFDNAVIYGIYTLRPYGDRKRSFGRG